MENRLYDANYLQISRSVLEQNAKAVVDAVKVPVLGVLKFDGYFIGLAEAAKAWQAAGVTMFAVSESWEALQLRREGFTEDILLMAPVVDEKTLAELVAADSEASPCFPKTTLEKAPDLARRLRPGLFSAFDNVS